MEVEHDVEIPIQGQQVSRCCIDWAVVLDFLDDFPDVTIRIEAVFRLTAGTTTQAVEPSEPGSAGQAAVLVRMRVARAVALVDGTLDIRFADGAALVVPPDPRYEAWTLASSDGLRLVSLPGGKLAIWDPPDRV